ncbi:hypothetical protein P8C59_001064 [Phyllachora maydis]|uniref:Cellobiose dehydrogenase-like cytochrome domain-containing protein n=1 Tax=Phyllachora maydis TaxID=1825666 RepID=A0AAD9HXG5_9PEZI|nr:hypothetical protein P8C59_001064 [Phyllachora maydis]
MYWACKTASFAVLAAVLGSAQKADSSRYLDGETGLTFASYTSDNSLTYRIAVPSRAPNGSYDAVIQIAAPVTMGWAGFAWGGKMANNPLAVAWANGTSNAVISSREASGYVLPAAYAGATYTVLSAGTHVNATHWQVTAQCSGCTSWANAGAGVQTVNPTAQNTFAIAFAAKPPKTPESNASAFGIHDGLGRPVFDLAQGANANLTAKVKRLQR